MMAKRMADGNRDTVPPPVHGGTMSEPRLGGCQCGRIRYRIDGKPLDLVVCSGRSKTCTFCGDCGARICHQTNSAGISVKAGTLDDTSDLSPTTHYWTKRKQPWIVSPDGVKCVTDDGLR